MDRRTRIIILAAGSFLLALILLFILWWLLRPRTTEPIITVDTDQGLQIPTNLPATPEALGPVVDRVVPQADQAAALRSVAVAFAERYGSYSNQNSFANLESLADIITLPMRINLQALQASGTAQVAPEYYGITTRALSISVGEYNEVTGQASLTVETQRQEARRTTINPNIFYQPLYLNLVRDQGKWKVDQATWGTAETR